MKSKKARTTFEKEMTEKERNWQKISQRRSYLNEKNHYIPILFSLKLNKLQSGKSVHLFNQSTLFFFCQLSSVTGLFLVQSHSGFPNIITYFGFLRSISFFAGALFFVLGGDLAFLVTSLSPAVCFFPLPKNFTDVSS